MKAARSLLLLALVALACTSPARAEPVTSDSINSMMMAFINDLSRSLGSFGSTQRRLLTLGGGLQSVQSFFHDMLGSSWQDFVPSSWTAPSFDWSMLGEFEYSSSLGDFVTTHDLANLTAISSIKDLHSSMDTIESSFCKAEAFNPSKKVPASCTGPTVSLSLVPKTCVLESATKQIVCSPAQLVLTKTPGSCTHKYHSASVWVGKACKISGVCGFNESTIIGGGQHNIPLTQIDIGFTASPARARVLPSK
ncbi:hypothetical protein ABPG75_001548 [Micractinium tetrahymenae]